MEGNPWTGEVKMRGKTGELSDVFLRAYAIKDDAGKILGLAGVHTDITERKQAEEMLRESTERFRLIFDNSNDGILVADTATRKFLLGNQAICRMLGYTPEELKELGVNDIHPQKDLPAVMEAFDKQLRQEIKISPGLPVQRKDGSVFYADINSFPLNLGDKTYLVGVFRDITERRKADDALRESEERYRTLIENVGEGIGFVNPKEQFAFANSAAEDIFGVPPSGLLGHSLYEFARPEQFGMIREQTDRRRAGEKSVYEIEISRPDGEKRNLLITAVPQFDSQGQFVGAFGVFRDITERRQAEKERNSLQEQLIRSEKLAAVGELIAGVVHEINNPLTGMKGLSELLMKETQDEEKKKDLMFIHQSSERIERIVKNLQRFARREEPTRKDVNINELIDVVISIRNYEMEARSVKVERDYLPDLPLVMADPSQLEQVFLNLITNAEYAIHDNQQKAGTLTIATSVVPDNAGGETVVIEFSDTGTGIPIEVLPKLFNPFFTTKGVGKGTGLGLSTSYGIIKGHGGEIYGGNRAEGGAVFTVKLPVQRRC
jgi:PAS domain S-box-containing protein